MASVYRQSTRSENWVARFKGPDGKWTARSTGLSDRPAALKLAFLWEGNLTDEAMANPTAARIDLVVRSIFESSTGSKIERAPVAIYLREWAQRVGKLKAPSTAVRYSQVVEDFLRFLGDKRSTGNLSTVRAIDLQRFIDSQITKGNSGSTASMAVKTLRIPFNIAVRQGIVAQNPCLAIELPDEVSQTREAFTADQVEALLRVAEGEWRTATLLGAYAGMRLGDAVSLAWNNVDLVNEVIIFVPQKTSRGRRRKEVAVPIHPTLLRHLNSLPGADRSPGGLLTPKLGVERIGGRSGLSREFSVLVKAAGIEVETITRKAKEGAEGRKFRKLSFHSLRHSFNSFLANAGVDQEVRQKLTGHASAAMNAKYTHLELKTMKTAIGKLPMWTA